MRDRVIVVAVVALAALGLVLWLVSASGDDDETSGSSATTTSTPPEPTSTGPTTTSTTTTTAEPGTTSIPGPGPVTELEAYSGAGSGEIELMWRTLPDAVGYRVLRADTADGTFTTAAEIDVTTGAASAEDAINVWSDQHRYLPPGDPFTGRDTAAQVRYVEHGEAQHRCFRVVAIGPSGLGPESATVCGSPP